MINLMADNAVIAPHPLRIIYVIVIRSNQNKMSVRYKKIYIE